MTRKRRKRKEIHTFDIYDTAIERTTFSPRGIFTLIEQKVGNNFKQKRVEAIYNLSPNEALTKMKRHDKTRKAYHNYYAEGKWGDSRSYDLTINSSKLGVDQTVEMLLYYIEERMQCM